MFTTEYIKKFAQESVLKFRWHYSDYYSRALLLTITTLKVSKNVSKTYLFNTDKIISGHANLYKLIGLRFVKRVHEKKLTDLILSQNIPGESPLFINTFNEVLSELYREMSRTMPPGHTDRINSAINIAYEANLVYCWHYLNSAKHQNMVDKLVEELYLLKEIEAFKNRKGE